jgi:hypothetical protein
MRLSHGGPKQQPRVDNSKTSFGYTALPLASAEQSGAFDFYGQLAAQQLAEHHFDGQKHSASTIDHYLNGGTRENLPKEGQ